MNWLPSKPLSPGLRPCLGLVILSLFAAGCGDGTRVYRVPKESDAKPEATASLPAGHPEVHPGSSPQRFHWKMPAGWTESPRGGMRVASFNVKNAEGKQADVSVIPLAGTAGGDGPNVNRWRSQVGLAPESEELIKKTAQIIEMGGSPAELHDLSGTSAEGTATRILGAIQHRSNTAWFFKMTGDDALVAREKPAFIEFLKSFQAMDGTPIPPGVQALAAGTGAGPASSAIANDGKPKWQPPAAWNEVSAGQFLAAKFSITGEAGAQAAVNVSRSSGDGGGVAANINRWRGQLAQPEWSPAEFEKNVQAIPVAGNTATLVEMSGKDSGSGRPVSLIGAIVKLDGESWFYKLMGDPKVVEREKPGFINFVKGVSY